MNRVMTCFAFVLTIACAAAAEDAAPSASALLDQAVATHGGRAALLDLPDFDKRGTVESFRRGPGRRWKLVVQERADGAYRREVTIEFRGRRFTPVSFWDGAEAHKQRFRRGWDDLPVDEAKEARDHRLDFLVRATEREATVIGAASEDSVDVWQIQVEDGRDHAILMLAQDDGRLIAMDYPATKAEGMGTKEEIRRKEIYRDLRKVGKLLLPFDTETLEDGSPSARVRYDSIETIDSFDEAWLRVPNPGRRFIPSEELIF